ncbi:restriction endonuclease subunit S [Stutzerimonas stutzeri]|uniref:restriction endonuclease subunit S n=1 Tax=Stutzerimonas stutzeri TaxID=316 RepID=UPI003D04CA07
MSFPAYPAYKDSGVEWLGEVPQHWPVYSLKRTVDGCVNGLWGDEPDGENDIAVIRVADFERSFSIVGLDKLTYRSITPKERQSRLIKSGDLLIEKSGGGEKTLVGCVVLFTHEFEAITSNFVARMRPLAEFDSQFLCYAFGNLYHGRVNYPSVKQVTGIQNLDAESYLQERFSVPSRVEQTQIVRFLDHETARIDALIEEQQRLIELLKEKRQAVIARAVTKGLDPTVPMKDPGVEWLGEVPAHWVVLAIKWRARIKSGDGISPDLIESQAQEDKPHPVIGGNGVMGFTSQANVSPPLIVIGRVGALCGNVHKILDPAWVSDNALILDFDRRSFDINYLVHVLDARNLNEISDKSAQPLITGSKVTSQYIPCPSRHEQLAIAKFLEGALSEVDQLVLEGIKGIELLKERRSALISAAVTGKIDVRGWQPPACAPIPELVEEAV